MVRITFLTLTEDDALELAAVLHRQQLLIHANIQPYTELLWTGDGNQQRLLTRLSGFTKALLYNQVERTAAETLGSRLVRAWAQPVTAMDRRSTEELMSRLAKV